MPFPTITHPHSVTSLSLGEELIHPDDTPRPRIAAAAPYTWTSTPTVLCLLMCAATVRGGGGGGHWIPCHNVCRVVVD